MLTTEKILRYLSILIVFITVIFSISVVVRELLKPEDYFKRIVLLECNGNYTVIGEGPEFESDLSPTEDECLLITEESLFSEYVSKNGALKNHQYIFFGEKGVLIKKESFNHKVYETYVSDIFKCFSNAKCSGKPETSRSKLTVTMKLIDQGGDIISSATFEDEIFSTILKNSRRLLHQMVKIKEQDISNLRLVVLFHSRYAFIENKDPDHISNLMKRDIDGLYLKSRGAKIRLLPHEYNDNPIAVISRKGRQYGLERDEYKKDEATLYLFRTVQFIQKNKDMVEWGGRYSYLKSDYSDDLSARLISKQIRTVFDDNRSFEQETFVFSGKTKESAHSLLIQLFAARALLNYGNTFKDQESIEIAVKALSEAARNRDLSIPEKSLFLELIKLCSAKCYFDHLSNRTAEIEIFFKDIESIKEYIDADSVYTGLIINGIREVFDNRFFDEMASNIIVGTFNKFDEMSPQNRIRYLGYLFSIDMKEMPKIEKTIRNIVREAAPFLESIRFDNRGFRDFRGGVGIKNNLYPGALFTSVMAVGLGNLVSSGITDRTIIEFESETGNFLRYLIVTEDDRHGWGSPLAKSRVQGGVRAHLRSDHVRLINSSLALDYFVNRIGAKRSR